MIPKIIHYCWFGRGQKSSLIEKCIESWKKFLPDYEIKEWNEDNFDVYSIPYTTDAYNAKKYAFVSDYARFKVLYDNGGIYLDVDVEVLKSLDKFLENSAFSGFETMISVNPGLILGAEKNNIFIKNFRDKYINKNFLLPNGAINYDTVVKHMTDILVEKGLILNGELQNINHFMVYPMEYFSPKSFITGEMNITANTHAIHHYAGSWVPWYTKLENKLWKILGLRNRYILKRLSEAIAKK